LQRLKQARQQASLTQVQVARKLRRPQPGACPERSRGVSKIESGERRVDVIELIEFARLYRKSLSFFVGP